METILQILMCLLIADFLSGVVHWFEDSYLSPSKYDLFNKWVVEPNIDHHKHPGSLRSNPYWSHVNVSVILVSLISAGMWFLGIYYWQIYLTLALLSQANYIHALSHGAKPNKIVKFFQDIGLLQSPKHHAKHHIKPWETRFCVMTNYLNPILDKIGFWRIIEIVPVKRGKLERSGF